MTLSYVALKIAWVAERLETMLAYEPAKVIRMGIR